MLGRGRAAAQLENQLVRGDAMHDAAVEYRDEKRSARESIEGVTGEPFDSLRRVWQRQTKDDVAYESFLDGARWDAAHNGREELLDSNEQLRNMLMKLLVTFALKPCPKCNSEGWDMMEMGECKNCGGNCWLPDSKLLTIERGSP